MFKAHFLPYVGLIWFVVFIGCVLKVGVRLVYIKERICLKEVGLRVRILTIFNVNEVGVYEHLRRKRIITLTMFKIYTWVLEFVRKVTTTFI